MFSGLKIGNNDAFASVITLERADAIVMNDGSIVLDWPSLDLDWSTNGAGGLDTGSLQASRCYSGWAIRNSSTGERALLGHLERKFSVVASVASSTGGCGLRNMASRQKLAQRFSLASAGMVEIIDIELNTVGVVGNPRNVWMTIQADNGSGAPSGTPLQTSAVIDPKYLCDNPTSQWVRMTFQSPASLSAGNYFVVMESDYPIDGSNFISWNGSTTENFQGLPMQQFDGSAWSSVLPTFGAHLTVYVTIDNVPLALPAGYDQFRLITYFFSNPPADNIFGYSQQDRVWEFESDQPLNPVTASWPPTLYLIDGFLPPAPCMPILAASKPSSSGRLGVGRPSCGYSLFNSRLEPNNSGAGWGNVWTYLGAGSKRSALPSPILTDFQTLYIAADTGTSQIDIKGFVF